MAKALMGHIGFAPDSRIIAELRRLQEQVRRLEADNDRLRSDNARLVRELTVDHDMTSDGIRLHEEMLTLTAEQDLRVDENVPAPALT